MLQITKVTAFTTSELLGETPHPPRLWLNLNDYYILFSPIETFACIAKSCQINRRKERTKTSGSIFFTKIRYYKVKLLFGNSAITEVNKLKNIKFTFQIFQMQIFHIYNLKSKVS